MDLDLGNYERFLDIKLTRDHNITTGKVYQASYFINVALSITWCSSLRCLLKFEMTNGILIIEFYCCSFFSFRVLICFLLYYSM